MYTATLVLDGWIVTLETDCDVWLGTTPGHIISEPLTTQSFYST